MQDFFNALTKLAGEFAAEPQVKAPIVFAAWRRTSGLLIRDNARPIGFEDPVLKVAVRDKNWQRQLADHAREYLFKVNSMLNGISVDRIDFVIMPGEFERSETVQQDTGSQLAEPSLAVATAARAIPDSKLRDQFLRAAMAAENSRSST